MIPIALDSFLVDQTVNMLDYKLLVLRCNKSSMNSLVIAFLLSRPSHDTHPIVVILVNMYFN
jgi:hypothetical protein